MTRALDVDSAALGDVDGQCVETLDQAHGVDVWMARRKNGQLAPRRVAGFGRPNRGAFLTQVRCKRPHTAGSGFARNEKQEWKSCVHQADRPVQEFRAAESLGMNIAD